MVAVSVARRFLLGGHSHSELGSKRELGDGHQDPSVDNLSQIRRDPAAWRIHCLSFSRSRRFAAARDASKTTWSYCQRRSKNLQGSAIAVAVLRCKLQNFGQGSIPVDGAEQPVLERVDRANKIGKCVRPVYQHRDATRRQTFPNAHRPWQRNGNVVAPTIAGKVDRLARIGAIVAVGDEAVRDHCSAEELDGGVLQPGGQRG